MATTGVSGDAAATLIRSVIDAESPAGRFGASTPIHTVKPVHAVKSGSPETQPSGASAISQP